MYIEQSFKIKKFFRSLGIEQRKKEDQNQKPKTRALRQRVIKVGTVEVA